MGDVFCPPCPLRFSPSLVPLLHLFPPLFISLSQLLSPSNLPCFPSRAASYLYSTHLHQNSQLLTTSLPAKLPIPLSFHSITTPISLLLHPSTLYSLPSLSFLPPLSITVNLKRVRRGNLNQTATEGTGVCVCARVCVCVCVRERERERERQSDRRDCGRSDLSSQHWMIKCKCVCVCVCVFLCVCVFVCLRCTTESGNDPDTNK